MARRRQKVGIGRLAVAAAAIAEVTAGAYLKNAATDRIRTALPTASAFPGGAIGKAVTMVAVSQLAAIEMNKLGVNPAFGPVRLL